MTLPVPVNDVPRQQKIYCPEKESNNNWVVGLLSSCKMTSKTATVNEQVAVLPEASVAVQVTVVTPIGNIDPDGGVHATVTPGQLSDAVGGG